MITESANIINVHFAHLHKGKMTNIATFRKRPQFFFYIHFKIVSH